MAQFSVLLGPDYSGKSTALTALAADPDLHVVSYDDPFVADHFPIVGRVRDAWVSEAFPRRHAGRRPGRTSTARPIRCRNSARRRS